MTYRKICIPESHNNKADPEIIPLYIQKSSERKEPEVTEYMHSPEIVVKKSKYTALPQNKKGIFHISSGKIIAVTVLCAASFTLGCSVTNEKLAGYIDSVAAFSSGKYFQDEKAEGIEPQKEITVYEKYMPSDMSDGFPAVKPEYLSLEKGTTESDANNMTQPSEVEVSGVTDINTVIDGETVFPVFAEDMSVSDVHVLNNQTKYKPDTYALISKTPKALENLTVSAGEPLVLVVHTHGTECYNSSENESFVNENTPSRSENTDENVVGVGRKLVSVLNGFGIPAVHSERMCDKDSFVNAYATSLAEVQRYLEKYPSIRFVIDLHRDAIENSDGSMTKPAYDNYDSKSAQLMFVVGTNQSGANHAEWKENLSLALTLQNEMSKSNPKLFRKINLRTASFNQQLSSGYLLLECGSFANTLEEAENAVEIFATEFARIITDYIL